jgi:tripartite-type tricarboxylate transporter receptor subunit TctC
VIDRRTAVAALAALGAGPLHAQQASPFPSKPIRIVPFGTAGGPIDTLARAFGDKLQARWGQPIIVDAKPGASGIIAADFVAKSAPDGHTVMFTLPLTHVNVPILQAKVPYDPVRDFTPLSMVASGGPMLVARANAPYASVREFLDFAKKAGKPLSYGTWGTGSTARAASNSGTCPTSPRRRRTTTSSARRWISPGPTRPARATTRPPAR